MAWTKQVLYLPSSPTEAISLQWALIQYGNTVRWRTHQVSSTWHDENFSTERVDLGGKWTIDNSSCSWANYCTWVSEMLFLEHAAKLNPPTRTHRSLFNLQVTRVGYGETWKEKGVVKTFSMKRSHTNHPLPCATLKSFTQPMALQVLIIRSRNLSNKTF